MMNFKYKHFLSFLIGLAIAAPVFMLGVIVAKHVITDVVCTF